MIALPVLTEQPVDSTGNVPPFIGEMFPLYPPISATCRVTGPSIGNNVYPAVVTQTNDPTLPPRDRFACYVREPNGIVLGPGFYDCDLKSSYLNLPLYYTACCPITTF